MIEYFSAHPEKLDVLRAEAQRWLGTPFRANSAACGPRGGVECVRLSVALLNAAAALPAIQLPAYSIDSGSHLDVSPLLEFLRGRADHPDSARVARRLWECGKDVPPLAGDVLVMKAGRTPYHLAVALSSDGDFVHVLIRREVTIASLRDSTFKDALRTVFRPIVPGEED